LIACGAASIRWFSQVDPASAGLSSRYRWSADLMRWGGRLAGTPIPSPEHVPVDDPRPILRWMEEVLRGGGTPHLFTYPSSAVRLAQSACDHGADLRGTRLLLGGEPLTEATLARIVSTGARAVPSYGASECGLLADGCLAPEASDDMHFFSDRHVLIQAGPDGARPGLPPHALFVTSLRPTAQLILVNASLGDRGVVGERACGCPLDGLGWSTHLRAVRSFEKFTAGGMNFLDADVIDVLERVLPARFGGGPGDYQLVEEQNSDGRTGLRLLVHPAIGPLRSADVSDAFLGALGTGPGAARLMAAAWERAGLVRVERRAPLTTGSGKLLHLHQVRPPSALDAPPRSGP
jgi:hypothetical protein